MMDNKYTTRKLTPQEIKRIMEWHDQIYTDEQHEQEEKFQEGIVNSNNLYIKAHAHENHIQDPTYEVFVPKTREQVRQELFAVLQRVPAVYMEFIDQVILDNSKTLNTIDPESKHHPLYHTKYTSHAQPERNKDDENSSVNSFARLRGSGRNAPNIFRRMANGTIDLKDPDRAMEYVVQSRLKYETVKLPTEKNRDGELRSYYQSRREDKEVFQSTLKKMEDDGFHDLKKRTEHLASFLQNKKFEDNKKSLFTIEMNISRLEEKKANGEFTKKDQKALTSAIKKKVSLQNKEDSIRQKMLKDFNKAEKKLHFPDPDIRDYIRTQITSGEMDVATIAVLSQNALVKNNSRKEEAVNEVLAESEELAQDILVARQKRVCAELQDHIPSQTSQKANQPKPQRSEAHKTRSKEIDPLH